MKLRSGGTGHVACNVRSCGVVAGSGAGPCSLSKCSCFLPCRKCAEHPTSDALHEDYKVLSPRVVIDLHKFLSCAKVLDEKEPFGIELVRSLKTIAALASATSPRVNLMFRSNPRPRSPQCSVLPGLVCSRQGQFVLF